ncbi:MAG: response regulator [Cellvibrionales bacterium]|nr:response regulator [Cellvibrionales bacterium]
MRPLRATKNAVKVVVVDDSNTIRKSAETILSRAGCEVITAVDGYDALAKIVAAKPDLILLDIMMPRLDGYQTLALVRSNAAFKSTPVVMLSSKDGLFDKAKARTLGSNSYLNKPFSKQELLAVHQQYAPGTP